MDKSQAFFDVVVAFGLALLALVPAVAAYFQMFPTDAKPALQQSTAADQRACAAEQRAEAAEQRAHAAEARVSEIEKLLHGRVTQLKAGERSSSTPSSRSLTSSGLAAPSDITSESSRLQI